MSDVLSGGSACHRRFFLWVGVLAPALLAAAALLLRDSGLDFRLSAFFFDADAQQFLIPSGGWWELAGHRIGRALLQAFWLILVATALASHGIAALADHRRLLWCSALAMALGPLAVALLKDINTHVCPWSLSEFGGVAEYSAHWFVSPKQAGRCFPGGHASGGFSLFALAFAGQSLDDRRLRMAGGLLGLGIGLLFSLLRVAQGAHFMSHNLWSAAIDLWACAIVFAPMLLKHSGTRCSSWACACMQGSLR